MATLHEREHFREAIMKTLYEAVEGNSLLGLTGAQLREDLVPEEDLAAACMYWAAEGLIEVDWARGNTRDGHADAQGDPARGDRGEGL